MEKRIMLALIAVTLTALLFGCASLSNNSNSFVVGTNFNIQTGQTFSSDTNSLQVTLLGITDSRCPANVVCVWAGELGVDVRLADTPHCPLGAVCDLMLVAPQEIHLGLTTKLSADYSGAGYSIKIVSINPDTNSAIFVVTQTQVKVDPNPAHDKSWFSIEPKQCNSNAWDAWNGWSEYSKAMGAFVNQQTEEHIKLQAWLKEVYGISVVDLQSRQARETVCTACSCPTGEMIAVLVDTNASAKMIELGFNSMEPIACTMEAKACPDGVTYVGRTAPFCEFESCTTTHAPAEHICTPQEKSATACTMEYMPVCGKLVLNTNEVSKQTYGNGCGACVDMKVVSYVPGECIQEQGIVPGSSGVGIANPASTNCVDHNGTLTIVDTNDGQVGMCTLENGNVCEEWAYFRGECS